MKNLFIFIIIITFCYTNSKAQTVSTFIDSDGTGISGLTIDENFLYVVASFSGEVYKKDITTSDNNYETFNIGGSGYEGICKAGNYVYISKPWNGSPGIYRFNPNDNTINFEYFISINHSMGLTNRNSELYFSSDDKIYKVDLNDTNPTPFEIASNINGNQAWNSTMGLKIYENFLYLTELTGISRINLDSGNYEKETITSYTGDSFARGSDENTFYLTGGQDNTAVYELDIQTQTYSILAQIENFIGTYDIDFANNSLFVTTREGASDKVIRIDLNPLSVNDFQQINTSIFPNPANDFINIKGLEPYENITIINSNGQLVKTTKIENDKIDISDLKIGVYFIKSRNLNSKFIKK